MIKETAKRIEESEGYRQFKYLDTEGIETIGIGFNLEIGFSIEECRLIVMHRLEKINTELSLKIQFYNKLPENIKSVLIDISYNLGVTGLLNFKKTLQYIKDGEYVCASIEMLESKWARQVGYRAERLANIVSNEQHK